MRVGRSAEKRTYIAMRGHPGIKVERKVDEARSKLDIELGAGSTRNRPVPRRLAGAFTDLEVCAEGSGRVAVVVLSSKLGGCHDGDDVNLGRLLSRRRGAKPRIVIAVDQFEEGLAVPWPKARVIDAEIRRERIRKKMELRHLQGVLEKVMPHGDGRRTRNESTNGNKGMLRIGVAKGPGGIFKIRG